MLEIVSFSSPQEAFANVGVFQFFLVVVFLIQLRTLKQGKLPFKFGEGGLASEKGLAFAQRFVRESFRFHEQTGCA